MMALLIFIFTIRQIIQQEQSQRLLTFLFEGEIFGQMSTFMVSP